MGLVPEELTPTALAKIPSWALVHEPSQDSRDAIHTGRIVLTGEYLELRKLKTQATRPTRPRRYIRFRTRVRLR